MHLSVYGEGERYANFGSMPAEMACVKYIVTGQSMIVMMLAQKLKLFVGRNDTSGGGKLSDVKTFLQNLQPAEVIAFMNSSHSSGLPPIQFGVLSEKSLCYVPPGWVVCEKVLNQRVNIGVRLSFLPQNNNEQAMQRFKDNLRAIQELVINGCSHGHKTAVQLGVWLDVLWSRRGVSKTSVRIRVLHFGTNDTEEKPPPDQTRVRRAAMLDPRKGAMALADTEEDPLCLVNHQPVSTPITARAPCEASTTPLRSFERTYSGHTLHAWIAASKLYCPYYHKFILEPRSAWWCRRGPTSSGGSCHPHRMAKTPCRPPPDAGGNEPPELPLISAHLRCIFRI